MKLMISSQLKPTTRAISYDIDKENIVTLIERTPSFQRMHTGSLADPSLGSGYCFLSSLTTHQSLFEY